MKSAHLVCVTPNRCGLYESTRDLVVGLRARGIDARMVDPTRETNNLYPSGDSDRGAPLADDAWGLQADVLINHSGLGERFEKSSQPIVHVAHGRPRSSFLIEAKGGTPIFSYHYAKDKDPRFKSVVTFWPEHEPYLRVMFPTTPVHVVQASVDLQTWTPGPAQYDFRGKKGAINVVCSDPWRDDVDPFIPLHAYALWAREMKGAKLHLYGKPAKIPGFAAIIKRIQDDGNMGELQGWVTGLQHIYRAADFVLTANEIDTRTVREAMACGCPVVRVGSKLNGFRTSMAQALDASREEIRRHAEQRFDSRETARQFEQILRGIHADS